MPFCQQDLYQVDRPRVCVNVAMKSRAEVQRFWAVKGAGDRRLEKTV
jgi:hypothetical protein